MWPSVCRESDGASSRRSRPPFDGSGPLPSGRVSEPDPAVARVPEGTHVVGSDGGASFRCCAHHGVLERPAGAARVGPRQFGQHRWMRLGREEPAERLVRLPVEAGRHDHPLARCRRWCRPAPAPARRRRRWPSGRRRPTRRPSGSRGTRRRTSSRPPVRAAGRRAGRDRCSSRGRRPCLTRRRTPPGWPAAPAAASWRRAPGRCCATSRGRRSGPRRGSMSSWRTIGTARPGPRSASIRTSSSRPRAAPGAGSGAAWWAGPWRTGP